MQWYLIPVVLYWTTIGSSLWPPHALSEPSEQNGSQNSSLEPTIPQTTIYCKWKQGQARGYGRITHFLPLPTWGHDFPWAIVTQPVGIFQTPGCHMKDMDIIFP